MIAERSLFDCQNAKVRDQYIICSAEMPLYRDARRVRLLHWQRRAPLCFAICNNCASFEGFGDVLPDDEKGPR